MYTEETDFFAVEKGTRKILNYRSSHSSALEMMRFYPNAELVVAVHRQYPNGDIKSFYGHSWSLALRAANAGIENYHEFFE